MSEAPNHFPSLWVFAAKETDYLPPSPLTQVT